MIIAQISLAKQLCKFDFDDAVVKNLYKAALLKSGAGISNESMTKLGDLLSKAAESEMLKSENLGSSSTTAEDIGRWCDKMAKEGLRLGVLKDPATVLREAKEAKEAEERRVKEEKEWATRVAKEEKERAAREAKEERERAAREAKEEKERAAREAKEERDAAIRKANEAHEAAAEAARGRRDGIRNGSIVVLKASDLAAQTHKWDGKQIITSLSCFYADADEYRCVGGGARVDFASLEPAEARERIEKTAIRLANHRHAVARFGFSSNMLVFRKWTQAASSAN